MNKNIDRSSILQMARGEFLLRLGRDADDRRAAVVREYGQAVGRFPFLVLDARDVLRVVFEARVQLPEGEGDDRGRVVHEGRGHRADHRQHPQRLSNSACEPFPGPSAAEKGAGARGRAGTIFLAGGRSTNVRIRTIKNRQTKLPESVMEYHQTVTGSVYHTSPEKASKNGRLQPVFDSIKVLSLGKGR